MTPKEKTNELDMTPKEKSIQMMSWFDTYHIDEEKNVAFTFTHLTLEEKKYILTKSIDEIMNEYNCFFQSRSQEIFWQEVKHEIEKL